MKKTFFKSYELHSVRSQYSSLVDAYSRRIVCEFLDEFIKENYLSCNSVHSLLDKIVEVTLFNYFLSFSVDEENLCLKVFNRCSKGPVFTYQFVFHENKN